MAERSAISIGNFDGVHVGHRAIIRSVAEWGRRLHARVLALTFDPHPAAVLRPGREPLRLCNATEKIQRLREAGADDVILLEPTPQLLALTPRDFLQWLCERHHPAAIVEGPDFRFGQGRAGDVKMLAEMGGALGYETVIAQDAQVALSDHVLAPVSSSLIRWLLRHGRVKDAAICLSRPFELSAAVVRGEQRGRTLGIPTANLDPAALAGRALPGAGVYAGAAVLPDGALRLAAISVGVKPTFGGAGTVIEAHLLDYDGDLYGKVLTLRFDRWLRDQRPFPDADALKAQLQRDLVELRSLSNMATMVPA